MIISNNTTGLAVEMVDLAVRRDNADESAAQNLANRCASVSKDALFLPKEAKILDSEGEPAVLEIKLLGNRTCRVPIQKLGPQEQQKVREGGVCGWFGLKKWFLKPLTFKDQFDNPVTVLVGVWSAVQELAPLGLSSSQIRKSLDEGDLLKDIHSSLRKEESAAKIARCFKRFSCQKKEKASQDRALIIQQRKPRANEKMLYESKSVSDVSEIISELSNWERAATILSDKTTKAIDQDLISQNQTINQLILKTLKKIQKNPKLLKTTFVKAIKSSEDCMQAVAIFKIGQERKCADRVKKLPLYIAYLSTAPWNLRIDATRTNGSRVEGAATALIESAVFESIQLGHKGALALEAVPLALGFYRKLGFQRADWTPDDKYLFAMKLSKEKAKQLLASERAGRALL